MTDTTKTKLISVAQAMEMMGIKRTTFYAELKKGNIVLKRLGKRKSLVPLEAVTQWIESLPNAGGGHGV